MPHCNLRECHTADAPCPFFRLDKHLQTQVSWWSSLSHLFYMTQLLILIFDILADRFSTVKCAWQIDGNRIYINPFLQFNFKSFSFAISMKSLQCYHSVTKQRTKPDKLNQGQVGTYQQRNKYPCPFSTPNDNLREYYCWRVGVMSSFIKSSVIVLGLSQFNLLCRHHLLVREFFSCGMGNNQKLHSIVFSSSRGNLWTLRTFENLDIDQT